MTCFHFPKNNTRRTTFFPGNSFEFLRWYSTRRRQILLQTEFPPLIHLEKKIQPLSLSPSCMTIISLPLHTALSPSPILINLYFPLFIPPSHLFRSFFFVLLPPLPRGKNKDTPNHIQFSSTEFCTMFQQN